MRAILLVGALVLAGCQSAAERQAAATGEFEVHNASMKEVSGLSKAAHSKTLMQPGTWDSGMEVLSAEFADGPDKADQLAAVQKQQRHAVKCQTASDLKPLDIENLEKVAGTCTFPRFVQKGGKLDVEIQCTQANGAKTTLLYVGAMGKQAYDVTVDQKSGVKGQPGYAAIRMRVYGKRLGLCQGKPAA
ncbi:MULTISPECIES: DUF3617 family protein [unclassified Sphingomonas]|jgi:Protein of unknown function (DUF3617)|uniref:DUF3617 domain-containing protein n=1 Tax=unclassified Sphingomonas TaxID=196159 RepID=UPI0010F7AEF1|nr:MULTISPECIES: DUF3617 family protein [unclassified Sphingomonas]